MRRIILLALIIPAVLLLSTCEEFDPQWNGVWVDDTTVSDVVITLDFAKWSGTLRVENNDPTPEPDEAVLTIVEGSLDGDEDTLTATITYLYQEYGNGSFFEEDVIPLIKLFVITAPDENCPKCLGIAWPCSAAYKIEGDTITLTGDIILALTEDASNKLTATKQP